MFLSNIIHPKCTLKTPFFKQINGKDKHIHHLKNKPGKFVSIACILSSHASGKNYFFKWICKVLAKNFNNDNKKTLPTIICVLGIP